MGWLPRARRKKFSLVSLTAALFTRRLYARCFHFRQRIQWYFLFLFDIVFGFGFSVRIVFACVGYEVRARRASFGTVAVRLAAPRPARRVRLRWPLAVAINTRRASAPVDFGQSFAGESVRLRGTVVAGGEREAATARARRVAERTLRSGWVGFKAAEG